MSQPPRRPGSWGGQPGWSQRPGPGQQPVGYPRQGGHPQRGGYPQPGEHPWTGPRQHPGGYGQPGQFGQPGDYFRQGGLGYPPHKKSRTPWFLAGGGVVVIAVVVVLVVALTGDSGTSSPEGVAEATVSAANDKDYDAVAELTCDADEADLKRKLLLTRQNGDWCVSTLVQA